MMYWHDWLEIALGIVAVLLTIINRRKVWGRIKRIVQLLKPQGLTSVGKLLSFTIGETAYIAPHPYVEEREVSSIICQVIIGNPNKQSKTINTFYLLTH